MAKDINSYYRTDMIGAEVAKGLHRDLVGGLWDEIGQMQIEVMKKEGLEPYHTLLDIGCGSLRGGVGFVRYLEPGHYYGTDLNESLIDAGYRVELVAAGLQGRQPRENLVVDAKFDFSRFDTTFDRAIAFSLFTHLPLNSIRDCLENLAEVMAPAGVFFATFFELPGGTKASADVRHSPGDIVTYGSSDPYHYRISDMQFAARDLPWEVHYVGDIGHPRAQKLIKFVRQSNPGDAVPPSEERGLGVVEASTLGAGADHYRAYVGPPDRFDFMSATQFALLFQLGMRDNHRVLDFGCGSLRLGRLLVPFLQADRYFGIDPNKWLIADGLRNELGQEAAALKRPRFAYNEDFNCAVFSQSFDFIIAQSIITHTGPELASQFFASSARAVAEDGIILFSYIRDESQGDLPAAGWHYPDCVRYKQDWVANALGEAGLVGVALPWYHPGATWHAAARSAAALPTDDELRQLNGRVTRSSQFA